MYLNFSEVKELHLEFTNKCNAACPMCARNQYGGKTSIDLVPTEWTLEFAKKVLSEEFTQLRNIMICGCYGDPVMAADCLEIIEFFKKKSAATIELYTNGSIRNENWWKCLGQLLNKKKETADSHYRDSDLVIFSIDGLEDTNHIYRRNTDFKKIIQNAKSFISAGGKARWDFIVFEHNQHQVKEAENLAKNLGFEQFRIRKTSRFYYSPDGINKHRVLNKNGELEYYIYPTTNSSYLNAEISKFEKIKNTEGGVAEYYDTTNIKCLYKTYFSRYYIDAHGKVFPCCYLGNDAIENSRSLNQDYHKKIRLNYGDSFNDLNLKTWDEILDSNFFKSELEKSWNEKIQETRLIRCARTCGEKFNPIMSQSFDTKLKEI
jgi:MoaA/NifB/PqqE/SkfB family radical SAM enzyme